MLEFIIGRSGSGKTQLCLEEIASAVAQDAMGKPLLLLTPAHLTYKLERKLAGMLSDKGSGFVRAQVFSFPRLARQVLLETGGAVYPRLNAMGKRLLLKKVTEKRAKELKVFAKAAKRRGFSADLADSIKEFKSFGISPEFLMEKVHSLDDSQLQEKVQDLAVLYEDFKTRITGNYNDAEDIIDALIKHIPESEYLKDAEIWMDGFAYFNPQERNIIAELLKTAKTVHVTLLLDTENEQLNSSLTGIFHDAWEIKEMLSEIAGQQKQEIKCRTLKEVKRFKASGIAVIEKELFGAAAGEGQAGGVRIVEAANRRRELEAVAVDIRRLCREEGYHWREIGILMRNPDDYGNTPAMVMADYDIPFFCDFKRPGVHHPLAELLRSSFEILHRWQYEPVFRAVKAGFFPLTREQIDLLENYVLRFDIKDARWTQTEDWKWVRGFDELENPDQGIDKEQQEELAKVNMLRRRIVEPLEKFIGNIRQAQNVREMTAAVFDYLEILKVPAQLEQWAADAEKNGRLADAEMHQQMWDDVIELLEQFVTMCGDEKMSQKDYEELLAEGLDALTVALIPPGLDYVTISSFDRNSLAGVRALYVIGANEGVMPRHCQEKGLLSDAERLRLAEHEIRLSAGARRESFSEANVLYRGFTTGSDYLWISYPLADSEGKSLKKSIYVSKLADVIMPDVEKLCFGIDEGGTDKLKEKIAEKRQAATALAGVLRNYSEAPQELGFWQDVYNYLLNNKELASVVDVIRQGLSSGEEKEKLPQDLAEKLYTKNNRLKASISRFESFNNCPFRHFLEHGLKLKERDLYKFQVREHGTFLHAVMAHFGEELKTEGKHWREITPDECHQRCNRIVDELAPRMMGEILYSTEQKNNLRARIQRTAEKSLNRLIEFDKISKFSPAEFERSFGLGENDAAPLKINLRDGFLLEVRGKIDRIDKSEDGKYYLVIDYKTGKMEINLSEVFYGIKMQLLTYLLLARTIADDDAVPAGVLYCFLKNQKITENIRLTEAEVKKEIDKELRMPGWLLADTDVVRLLDEKSQFIKVKLGTKGGFDSRSMNDVKSPEEFDILLRYMQWLLSDTGNKILAGEIAVRPYCGPEKACKYCNFRAVCRFDPARDGKLIRKPQKLDDTEFIKLMQEKGKEGA